MLQRLRTLPWQTRLAGVLAVVLLLAAAVFSNRPRTSTQLVPLLGDSRLQPLDLQRMRLALARAGIVDLEVRDQQLWLPKDRITAALKTIDEQDLLPGNLQATTLNAPQISPFVSRYQQQLQQQHQKKLAIQALLRRLTFVADASLEIDFVDPANSRLDSQTRCTITIQPVDGQYLDPGQLETIRQIAIGSLSQLRREELVIVDLAAGVAFDDKLLAQPQTAAQIREINLLRCRQKLDREIHRALADLGELEIEISARASIPASGSFAPGSIAEASPARPRGMLAAAQLNLPGSNGVASVAIAPEQAEAENLAPLAGNPREAISEFNPQIIIRLARTSSLPAAAGSASLAQTMEQDQLRQEILRRVRPLLPQTAFSDPGGEPVVVEFSPRSDTPGSAAPLALPWGEILGSRTAGIWIAVLSTSGLGLLLVLSLRRREQPASHNRVEESNPAESEVREQHLREQIDELLRTHPDTAANVIREWIHKAA